MLEQGKLSVNNASVGLARSASAEYPQQAPFHPPQLFPENEQLPGLRTDPANAVYGGVRESFDSLKSATEQLLDDTAMRSAMRSSGIERSSEFTLERFISQLVDESDLTLNSSPQESSSRQAQ